MELDYMLVAAIDKQGVDNAREIDSMDWHPDRKQEAHDENATMTQMLKDEMLNLCKKIDQHKLDYWELNNV